MKLTQKMAMICITLLVASCASTRPQLAEIQVPPERIKLNGYSLVPLNEKGWIVADRNGDQLALGRQGDNPDETFVIQAIPFKLPAYKTKDEFVSQIKEGQIKDTDPQRFKIVSHEVSAYPVKGADCVKAHMIADDSAATKRSGKTGDMVLEVTSLNCALPGKKDVGISIAYSQRNYPGQGDPAFEEKAASILDSVAFTWSNNTDLQYSNNELLAEKFSAFCMNMLKQTSTQPQTQSPSSQPNAKPVSDPEPLQKLASMRISIGQNSGTNSDGSYALFQKGQNEAYSLITIKPYFVVPNDLDNQEVLFVSPTLDHIAPAYESYNFQQSHNAFLCVARHQSDSSLASRRYGPCSSSLTKAGNVSTELAENALSSFALLTIGFLPGSFSSYVDTDKDKVAELVVNSKLLQCLNEVKLNELKAAVAKEISDSHKMDGVKDLSVTPKAEWEQLGNGDCSEGGTKVAAETYFSRGKDLMAKNDYKSAMVCFMRAQEEEKGTQVYRDSCSEIATMYELGWGVDKNMDESRAWLRKAGL
jgi:hypothetical protein